MVEKKCSCGGELRINLQDGDDEIYYRCVDCGKFHLVDLEEQATK